QNHARPRRAAPTVRSMTLIKICGITNLEDAVAAIAMGADALGFNFYKPSPRYVTPQTAREIIEQLPDEVLKVGVFVNEASPDRVRSIANESGITALQLHGDESPEYCSELADKYIIKCLAVSTNFDTQMTEAYQVDAIMFDTKHNTLRGGTGRAFDWSIAQQVSKTIPKLYLAGGLSPENVADAIETVRPFAVDACSSLETIPGKKDHERMRAFVTAVRNVKP
ncbi:MAG TPA: phosphoribosylanthranilate isomerase, partial [Pyrinomonadaceae bacterium]|nr:phosphoribosylanthranilate isomerase [Pyrinomonadaceae bacterium]